jgi:hypothetical protein
MKVTPETEIEAIILAVPPQPHGNIDQEIAARLYELSERHVIERLADLHELNALVGRALHLINNPRPSGGIFPTDGGEPTLIAVAA